MERALFKETSVQVFTVS